MRSRMLKALEAGDPLTFTDPQTNELKNAWLKHPHDGDQHHAVRVSLMNGTTLDVMPYLVSFRRKPSGPVGPPFDCEPCGHTWDEHDDSGCLWMTCQCPLPGERK